MTIGSTIIFFYFVRTSTCHLEKRNLPGCRSDLYFCSFWWTAAFHHHFRFPSRCWRWWCYSTAYAKTPSEKLGSTGARCFSASCFHQSRSEYHRCLRGWEGRMQQHLEKRVFGGQRTTAQGWRQEEQMTRQHLKILLRRNPSCLHSTRCVGLHVPPLLDIFPTCWMWTGDEVLCDWAPCLQVMEELLEQLEQPSKIPKDWPAEGIKEVLKPLTEGPWKLGKGCCRLKVLITVKLAFMKQ